MASSNCDRLINDLFIFRIDREAVVVLRLMLAAGFLEGLHDEVSEYHIYLSRALRRNDQVYIC